MKRTLATTVVAFAFATPAFAEMTSQQFVDAAAVSGLFEIQSSEAALKQNPSDKVKDFAERMIADHTAANASLKEVARNLEIAVPESLDDEHQQMLDGLQSEQDQQFMQTYVTDQVKGHEDTVQKFQTYIKEGGDEELVNFASTTLPTLQDHLNMAKQLQADGSSG